MRRKILALAAALAVLLLNTGAAAEPLPQPAPPSESVPPKPIFLHFSSNFTVYTDTRPTDPLRLPPGYFLDEDTWFVLDAEVKRLQDSETRLTAENKSLRASASWRPGWRTLVVVGVLGLAGGIYLDRTVLQ